MNFSRPELVASIIEDLKTADRQRAPVRALIESLFNGQPPYTRQEEIDNKIQINVNFKEGMQLLLQVREQFENAFLASGDYFTITIDRAPASKAVEWNGIVTQQANKVLKRSRAYLHNVRQKFGSVALHGIGSQLWPDRYCVLPNFIPIDRLLVPTDTDLTLENLTHFAALREWTPGELFRKTLARGENIDPGWDVEKIKKILADFKDLNQNTNNWNWYDHPEQMQEIWKQNQTYWDADSTPLIKFWDFYFRGQEENGCWYRVILRDQDCAAGSYSNPSDPLSFIYKRKMRFADSLDEILHTQFGDGNNKPPFKWWSVRSIGYMLYDTVQLMNRLRCQFTQKVFEDMMLLFRVQDPVDRSRLDKVYLGLNYGIVPDGLSFVKREERYSPDANLVEMLMANYKQLMGESTASYTQDIDQGTPKERTAFEVQTLLTQTSRLTGSILNLAYLQEGFAYNEICRRLTMKNNPDFAAKRFMTACQEQGVPKMYLNSERWDIEPQRVLGQGNMQLEQAQAQGLLNIRPLLNPEAQDQVLHEYVYALTHDARRAKRLAPIDGAPKITNSVHDSELVFAAFLQGVPVSPKPGTNPIDVIQTMLKLMKLNIESTLGMRDIGTPQQVVGLKLAARYVVSYIQMLSEDPAMKDRVSAYGKILGKLMNEVKGMEQRQRQAMAAAAKNQNNGEQAQAALDLQLKEAEGKLKLRNKTIADRQKLSHKQTAFEQDQIRKNQAALGEVQRDTMLATVEAGKAMRESPTSEEK